MSSGLANPHTVRPLIIRDGSAYLLGAGIRSMARHVIKRRRGKDPSPVTPEEAD